MVAVVAKALVSGTGMTFSGRRQISLLLGLGETHAGDTEETDEASVLEVLESSELSSTLFPKSCKMQFRNWQDRKGYSAEQEGSVRYAKGDAEGIRRKVITKCHLDDSKPSLLPFIILQNEWRKTWVGPRMWGWSISDYPVI